MGACSVSLAFLLDMSRVDTSNGRKGDEHEDVCRPVSLLPCRFPFDQDNPVAFPPRIASDL